MRVNTRRCVGFLMIFTVIYMQSMSLSSDFTLQLHARCVHRMWKHSTGGRLFNETKFKKVVEVNP